MSSVSDSTHWSSRLFGLPPLLKRASTMSSCNPFRIYVSGGDLSASPPPFLFSMPTTRGLSA